MSRVTEQLIDFASRVRSEDLDAMTVRGIKRAILDTLGCAAGGHATEAARVLLTVTAALRGTAEASIRPLVEALTC